MLDFLYFYNKNYNDTDMISNFKFYQHRYRYDEEEMTYFLLKLVIVEKIDVYEFNLTKVIEVNNYFDKLKSISDFILEYQKYNHKDKQNNFN